MPPRRGSLTMAQRQFLFILSFTVIFILFVNFFGPPSTLPQPPYTLSRTYLTSDCEDGRRLGNLIFNYASMVGIATQHNMTIVMGPQFRLFDVFEISAVASDHMDNTLGLHSDYEEFGRRASAYDVRVNNRNNMKYNTKLHGYFQSWKYFNHSQQRVMKELKFKETINRPAEEFIQSKVNKKYPGSAPVIVGIHVRRGDYLHPYYSNYGYSTADAKYFSKAMEYFKQKFKHILFVVCSDDIQWCRENIVGDNVVYSETGSDVIDLAILSHCNHTIMSTGSFGWWGAWLANGTTIYYDGWPKPVSILEYMVTKPDFFPPHWIPM